MLAHRTLTGSRVVRSVCALLVCVAPATPTEAFSLIRNGGGPADLENEPNRYYSFNPGVITWKMDSQFRDTYDDPVLLDQVRLAFREWEVNSSSATRRSSPRYRWNRYSAYQPVIDLKSVINHELGHALGFQHGDASWFNETDPNGNAWNRNYRVINGELTAAPPLGGEVMNEGNNAGFMPDNPSPKGIRGGEYWRTLSKDEIAGLDYAYGAPIDFQEVGPNDDAMITVEIFQGSGGSNLGVSGPDSWQDRDPGDPDQGRLTLTASIGITNNANLPVGVIPRTSNWHFTNSTGESLQRINVRTEGTSTREPLDVFSSGPNRFNTYQPSNAVLLHAFENRGHRFSDPSGGTIPNNGSLTFGLQLDVWDWTVDRVTAVSVDDEPIPLSVISLFGWSGGGFQPQDPPNPGFSFDDFGDFADEAGEVAEHDHHGAHCTCSHCSHGGHGDHGFSTVAGEYVPVAQGFRVVANDTPGVLTELAFASIDGLGLTPEDLTPETLAKLDAAGELVRLPVDPTTLAPHEELVVVLDGVLEDLPPNEREASRFLMANDRRFAEALADGEVLVYGRIEGEAGAVAAFSLLNEAPIVGRQVPEPASVVLVALIGLALPRRGARG